jgi:hypothetical protein
MGHLRVGHRAVVQIGLGHRVAGSAVLGLHRRQGGDQANRCGVESAGRRRLRIAPLDATSGTSLIAGHVDYSNQGSGSSYFQHFIAPGADITVTADNGMVTQWRVYAIQVVTKS